MASAAPSLRSRLTADGKAGFVRWLFDRALQTEFPQLEGDLAGGSLQLGTWGQQFWTAYETSQLSRRQQTLSDDLIESFQTDPVAVQRYTQPLGSLPPVYREARDRQEEEELQAAIQASLSAGSSGSSSSSSLSSSSSSLYRPSPPHVRRRPSVIPQSGDKARRRRPSAASAFLFGSQRPPPAAYVPPPNSVLAFITAILDLVPADPNTLPGALPANWLRIFSLLISSELRRWYQDELPSSEALTIGLREAWTQAGKEGLIRQVMTYISDTANVDLATLNFAVRNTRVPALLQLQTSRLLGPPTLEQTREDEKRGLRLFFVRKEDIAAFVQTTVTDGNCFFDSIRQAFWLYDPMAESVPLPEERKELTVESQREFLHTYFTQNPKLFADSVLSTWMAQLTSGPSGPAEYNWLLKDVASYQAAADKLTWAIAFLATGILKSRVVYADNAIVKIMTRYYTDVLQHDVILHVIRNGPEYSYGVANMDMSRKYPAKTRLHIFVEHARSHYRNLLLQVRGAPLRGVFREDLPAAQLPAMRKPYVIQ